MVVINNEIRWGVRAGKTIKLPLTHQKIVAVLVEYLNASLERVIGPNDLEPITDPL